ncbi:nuclear pore glycoprotein p62-like [Gymnogyps californianus]|uniref:nuclear pore glycoprotein p62-like n=1 Tax=Gymnogyps californianus TaxID=33616 RepID=UPI0021CABE14|nr:nuclear pore glycoprotein p62-like [Gymnogyps californianus]
MNQFNFGSGAAGGGFALGAPKTTATTATTGFSFSTPAASGGFSFGSAAQTPASSQPAGLFSFSRPGTAAQPASFSFGTPAAATAAPAANVFPLGANAPKLNFGGSTATQATGITGGFGFGSSVPTSVPSSQAAAPSGFVFGSAGTTTAATTAQSGTTGGFTFSSGTTTQAGTASFSIGTAAPQAAPTGLTFGTAPAAAATTAATLGAATQSTTPFSLGGQSAGLNFGSLPSTAATSAPTATLTTSTSQGPALSFGTKLGVTSTAATTASTTTTSILGSTGPTLFASIVSSSAPTSSATTGLSLGAPSTGTASLGMLGFGLKVPGTTAAATSTATSTTSASGFALNLKPLTTTGAIGAVTSTAAITTTTTTSAPPVMTYAQLESLINKWSLELEDQEKHFLHQATQVNAWDRMLIENGEKITSLHREVEKVKLDQKRLDQELDFILSQQKELEDLLTPLEESVKEQSGTIYLQHADEERERTYKLAENIDAQLKHMAQDLKDIIEHLNTSGGPADTSDPLQQICKILNAHMDSLQWIEQNSAVLQRKVEEVTKVCESRRKEQERSFRITFD